MKNYDFKKDTIKINANKTKIIAHRGLSGVECENSIAAFVAAGNRNYFGIETDVHITADNNFIIIHDDKTDRVSQGKISIENSDYDSLRSIVLNDIDGEKRADLHLPNLYEYFKVCNRYCKRAVLELKGRIKTEDIKRIIEIADKTYPLKNVIFISFDYDNLVDIRNILPNAEIQYLCDCDVDDKLIEKLKKYNFNLDIYEAKLTQENIEYLHNNDILVNCWTCNNADRAKNLVKWGIDFITTNILQAE